MAERLCSGLQSRGRRFDSDLSLQNLAIPAGIIIGREITVSALREWMAELGARKKVAVSSLGKIKTIIQMVALVFLIFEKPFLVLPVYSIGIILIYIAVLLTLISMFQYLVLALPKLKK